MERLSDTAIEIINELHAERLDYSSEYIPLIDAANRLAAYEDTSLEPEQVMELKSFTQGGIHKVDDGWKHVQDLLQAENEGRLVVLPYIDQSLAEKYTLSIRRNDKTRTMVVRVEEKGESACTKN